MAACNTPAGSMSSTNEPSPRSRRGSSLRFTGRETLGGQAHRAQDVLVARATTQVAAQRRRELLVAWPRVVPQKRDRRHQEARRAETALEAMRLPERLLDRVQAIGSRRQAFHRADRGPVRLRSQHQAGPRRLAVDQDRAGATYAVLTADVRAGQAQLVTQEVAEQQARLDAATVLLSIDTDHDRDPLRHGAPYPPAGARRRAPTAAVRRHGRGPDGSPARPARRPRGRGTPWRRGCPPPGRWLSGRRRRQLQRARARCR